MGIGIGSGASMLSDNLAHLRRLKGYSQEQVAEYVGASRQAVAKWENGDSQPDIPHCAKLAKLFGVTLDDLVNYSDEANGYPIPPKGKHIFGMVTVGERGQIVIPKEARTIFGIEPGTRLLVGGDEEQRGLALMRQEDMVSIMHAMSDVLLKEQR